MIIIISEDNDYSTLEVIRWLRFYNVNYFRINSSDKILLEKLDVHKKECFIKVNNRSINLFDKNNHFWYRRGIFNIFSKKERENQKVKDYLIQENYSINEYIFLYIIRNKVSSINNYLLSSPNKLYVIDIAQQCGFKVPKTIITIYKNEIEKFLKNTIISKGINNTILFKDKSNYYMGYTRSFNRKDLTEFPDIFEASLFQEEIIKKFEVRVFFLNEKFFSMAIFSQNNPKTIVDFRNYDDNKPNRSIPISLPLSIEKKTKTLLKKLNINCASIDFLVNNNNEYIFLEINPIGQFGMVSKPCNYNIEKYLAQELLKYENK